MALFARATSIFIISNKHCSKLISTIRTAVTCTNLPSQFTFCGYFICRRYSTEPENKERDDIGKFVTFDNFLHERRNQAKRSILVEIPGDRTLPYLHNYCSAFGTVKSMFYYSLVNLSRYCLVEFESDIAVNLAQKYAVHDDLNSVIPVKTSSFLFRRTRLQTKPSQKHKIPLVSGKPITNMSQLFRHLLKAKTVSEQIETCYSILKLDDIELRLRFYMSNEIERCFLGVLPDVQVLPFGSTVNGFGKMGCDLDMLINLDSMRKVDDSKRLVFQTKPLELNGKYQQGIKLLDTIGEVLRTFCPGIVDVIKIMHARVPIIKFNNEYTGVQCDLSITNMSAIYMSELLYLYGEFDKRVRPVVFTIRKWAEIKELTCDNPGEHITNFSLTLLIIFYLQQKKIIPTLNQLRNAALKEDVRVTESNIDCTFLRDISKMQNTNSSSEDCFELLKGFFEFYSTFNYKSHGICLKQGKSTGKINSMALYIHNPLEASLNVSRNVSFKQIDRIRFYCREALWVLENVSKVPSSNYWGIIPILQADGQGNNSNRSKKSRQNPPNVLDFMNINNKSTEEDTNLQFAAN